MKRETGGGTSEALDLATSRQRISLPVAHAASSISGRPCASASLTRADRSQGIPI